MVGLVYRYKTWIRQLALNGTVRYLRKNQLWGYNHFTIKDINGFVPQALKDDIPNGHLKDIKGQLHTSCIDELVHDLTMIELTITNHRDVDDRLVYLSPQQTTFHTYLARIDGTAIDPAQAWEVFYKVSNRLTLLLDNMLSDDNEQLDRDYYLRRYQSVFKEALQICVMFLELINLRLPDD